MPDAIPLEIPAPADEAKLLTDPHVGPDTTFTPPPQDPWPIENTQTGRPS